MTDTDTSTQPNPQALERAFKAFAPTWPTWLADSEAAARKAWFDLGDDERQMAESEAERYLDHVKPMKKSICSLAVYLREKRWQKLPPKQDAPQRPVVLKPFGKLWMAWRLRMLAHPRVAWKPGGWQQAMVDAGKGHVLIANRHRAQFPSVARMDDEAELGRGGLLRSGVSLPDTTDYVAVEQGSAEWAAWQAWHEQNDVPFIKPPAWRSHVWFPAEIPPATAASEPEDELAHG